MGLFSFEQLSSSLGAAASGPVSSALCPSVGLGGQQIPSCPRHWDLDPGLLPISCRDCWAHSLPRAGAGSLWHQPCAGPPRCSPGWRGRQAPPGGLHSHPPWPLTLPPCPQDLQVISTDESQVLVAVQEWYQTDTYNLYQSDPRGVFYSLVLEDVRSSRQAEGGVIVDVLEVGRWPCLPPHPPTPRPSLSLSLILGLRVRQIFLKGSARRARRPEETT